MKRYAISGIILGVFVAMMIIYVTPPQDDFHIENPYWNGLSDFATLFNVTPLWSIDELAAHEPSKCALFIIGPSLGFSQDYVSAIKDFLRKGGLLVVADDFGSANEILEKLNLRVRISGLLLLDPFMKEKSLELPITFKADELGHASFEKVVLNLASNVVINNSCIVLLTSSPFSFLDLNRNYEYDFGEPKGPFDVACIIEFEGKSKVIVISDPSLFINSMIHQKDNIEFIKAIAEGRQILVDCFHWKLSTPTILRKWVSNALRILSSYEVRYLIPVAVALVLWRLKFHFSKPKAKRF
ncbi:MAG: DUF4350 domain-containing protein [Candidatus Nezhaarchaeales archaeon]